MRTPAGKECPHYHADFHRGRNVQECRLVQQNPASLHWKPGDCSHCTVPDILLANASHDMELKLAITPRLLGLGRKYDISATCLKHHTKINDPYVGCGQCNAARPGLDVFWQALGEDSEHD